MTPPSELDSHLPADERLTQRPLPPYSYVTGMFPHPTRDEQGHSHGVAEPAAIIRDPAAWRECEPYLQGIDLFNHGYYWDAHERWEAVWHAAGRKGTLADFGKGLIKLAAAGVKAREGRALGVARHAARAQELFTSIAARIQGDPPRMMGMELPRLIEASQGLVDDPSAVLDTRHAPVVVVMPFQLRVSAEPASPNP